MNIATKIISAGFDIAALNAPAAVLFKSHVVTVIFDNDGKHQAGFEIAAGGKNSEQYQEVIRATSTGAIQRSVQKKQVIDAATEDGAGALYDLGVDRTMKIAMAVIVGLPGFVDKGEPVPVTGEFLKMVFTKFPTWQNQVLAALEADSNFLTI